MSEKSDLATKYQKLDDISHVLLRPNTYVGGIDRVAAEVWVYDDAKIRERAIDYNAALYKIFDEAIMNARDHHVRTSLAIAAGRPGEIPVTTIAVDVSLETGSIKITNNGTAIPIEIHPEHKIYVIEMIFGHLRSSTNYNEAETRIGAGVNGVGIKCAFIFSKYARVEVVDQVAKKRYVQEFRNNLREICPPVITKTKAGEKSSVSIEFIPEYERFGFPDGLTPDFFALLKKRTFDIAAVTDKNVKVSFNGEVLPIKTFKQYISMYIADEDKFAYEENSARWEYAVALSSTNEFSQISFVNGIFTRNGGKHVEYILNQITKKIADYIEKKKKIQVRPAAIKEQLVLFLRCDIENPAFDSQSKDCMTLPIPKFGSTCTVSDAFCEKIAKMGVMDQACSVTEARENRAAAKKTDGSKTRTVRGIANFIDANFAGGERSGECTLILCEGLSAQSGVVSGLSSADRNLIGIYPLKGKVLNVRGETARKIAENKEITDLKKIMGLENGRKYTAADIATKLRYGKIMILTDADADGSHIKALCVNLFHCEWSTLIQIRGFLSFMNTPILRATRGGKQTISFYNQKEYDLWKEQQSPSALAAWKIKYFKGLGTSTAAEFKEYFANKKQVDFEYTPAVADDRIDQIFNKKRADERKKWLENYDKNLYLDTSNPVVKYEDFIDRELIHFSVYDCERSIPNLMDGLKISLRKILYCAFKRRLTTEIKVAQFSGYVSEHSCYHHGEQSLNSTLVGMAQDFVGSNNINLLDPKGQFGCLSPDTPILMWDSSIKEAKDIVVGDILVGDDGEKRTVLRTTSGIDDMYKITDSQGKTMTVNSQHILTLYYKNNFEIYWKNNIASWVMHYYDTKTEFIYTKSIRTKQFNTTHENHFNKSSISKEDAYNKMLEIKEHLLKENTDSKIIDIKLENYNKIAKNIKRRLFSVSNTQNIKMDKKEVPIDPYVFGVWLGDGDHNGHGFTTIDDEVVKAFALWADTINAEITHNNNSGRDDCYHYEIRRKGSGKLVSIGDKENSSITCKACINSKFNHPSCDWVFEKCEPVIQYGVTQNGQKRWDLNPFKEILKKNNLYKNKFIPDCYINNDEETRLQVLAGFIDTDGHLTNNNIGSPSYEISQSKRLHSELIEKISIIAQSLGFATSITYIKKNTTTKKGEDMTMIIVRIFGDIERIPCRIPRKKITNNTRIKHSMHYSPFTVEHVGKGKFCGWQVDKNERFLLGNYTVTHNSRLQGGSDSASERYIFTHLTDVARAIFPEADDQVLTYINDDGTLVEPEFYVPIIPFVLVNGQKGIGTGFSTSIPSYNPLDLIQYLRAQLTATAATQPDLLPYYEEFQGTVARISPSKYLIKGVYEKTAEDRIIIRELPIGTWTMPYITFLEELLDPAPDKAGKKVTPAIKDFANMSTESIVQIHVQFPRGALAALEAATDEDGCNGVHKLLKLTTTVSTTNMNLFTEELKLKKYETPEEIIADYFPVRMDAYVRRKKYLLENLEQKLLKMTNKARYIQAVLDDVIDLRRKTNQQVDDMLSAAQFDRIEDSFKYLTKLPMDSVSKENVAAILRDKEETEREFETLKNTTEKQMWAAELDELEQKYMSYRTARRAKHTEDGGAGDGVAQKKKARTIKIKA